MQTIVGRAWHLIVEINMFRSSIRRQPSDIKQQRWTTRIYFLCLFMAVTILTFYTSLTVQKKSIEVKKPTLETVLYLQMHKEFNSSLQCPCTQISVPYGQLVQLQPFYHQVCSSDFVKWPWLYNIRALLQVNSAVPLNRLDFRRSYQSFFLLSKLCDLVNQTIISSLQEFQRTQLVTGYLFTVNLFENQMNSSIQTFQVELISTFLRFFQLTRNISYINQYFSNANIGPFQITGLDTTFQIYNYQGTNGNSSYSCSCANNINCKSQLGLYNMVYYKTPKSLVPGLYRACFALESLLQSTLECFYDDQDCLANIIDFYEQSWFPTNFILLNSTLNTRFSTNSTIDSLLLQLFIEYWSQSLNYSSYFALCQPVACSYEISYRNSLLEIITTVLGLMSGLSAVLLFLVPSVVTVFVGVIQRQHHQHTDAEAPSTLSRFLMSINRIKNWFEQLNVFDNPKKMPDNNLEKQRRATYVYLLVLSITVAVLLMYNSVVYFPNTFTVSNPSLQQYEQLQQQYGVDAVNCPCFQVSITYSSFIDFECDFHLVCSSHFISDSYLQQLFQIYNALNFLNAAANAFTLSGTAFSHFQALRTLCNLVKDTFYDARQQYLTSSIISASMISYELFDKQMNESLVRFSSALPDEFLISLQLVRGMMQSNAFVSLYSTNWYPVIHNRFYLANVYMVPQHYGNCSCLTSASCTQQSNPPIPGYLVGCTPFESLLHSSLECLYNQTCIDNFAVYLRLPLPAPQPINIGETRFSQKDTIETIVKKMFIETCTSNISYKQFFEQCHPVSCSVTVNKRNSLITVITILFGLYGGLRIGLKLVVFFFVSFIYKIIRTRKATFQIQPQPCPSEHF